MATVLVLGASVSQLPAIRHARASGLRVVAVDGDAAALGFAEADASIPVDFADVDAVVGAAAAHGIDAVVAISSDRAVPAAAAIAERLGLPGIGVATARRMTDKATMRTALAAAGIPQPSFAVVRNRDEALRALDEIGLPAVVKPADSGGQRGVAVVTTRSDLDEKLAPALATSSSGRAIVETFVDGAELNGILVVRDGSPRLVTLSDRLRPPGPGFGVGWIHLFPSGVGPEVLRTLEEVAVAAVRALGLRDGIAFPQLLVSGDGDVSVVEVAARIPAGQMADLVRLGVGVDLIDIALRQARGERVDDAAVEPRFVRPLAIRFLTASPGILPVGRVLAVDGLDDVRSAPGVLEAGLYIQLGETIAPVTVDADRRGYVVATGADPYEALGLADAAARRLRVEVEPELSLV